MKRRFNLFNAIQNRQILVSIMMLLSFSVNTQAQNLETLCPVINPKVNKDKETHLVLGTLNYHHFSQGITPYTNSMQIISADQSWPPLWYSTEPLYTYQHHRQDSMNNVIGFSQIGYPEVINGLFSYLQLSPSPKIDTGESQEWQFDYSLIVLNKQMERIDTLRSRLFYGGSYGPGFKQNQKVEKLWASRKDGPLDLSSITGDARDKAVQSTYWVMEVLDQNDKVKWTWNPVYHLDPSLFQIKDKLAKRQSPSDKITLLKLENFGWDHDGDLLYSLEDGGGELSDFSLNGSIGKVSRQSGDVLWHFDCFGNTFASSRDTFKCVQPFNLQFVGNTDSSSIYSFYDWGYGGLTTAKGVVFERLKKTDKFKLLKYIAPKTKFWGNGHGGFDYNAANGNYSIEYGVFEWSDTSRGDFRNAMEYGRKDSTYAVYQLPRENYTFGFHRLENWPIPPRPIITQKGNELIATGEMKEWTWYKLEGPANIKAKRVGTGSTLKFEKDATYCVVGPYGIGYSVSVPFTTKKNAPY
jgi:hypothetical protein